MDVLRGMPVFTGTHIPAQTLWDYLEAGQSIDDFLDECPDVHRAQVMGLLNDLKKRMLDTVS